MVGTVSHVIYPALIFIAIHMASSTPLRASLVRRLGERGYTGLFSLASALSLGWMIWAYGAAPAEALWSAAGWSRLLIWALMPFSIVLVVLGLTTPNPTMAMSESRLGAGDPAPGILKITRHPMLWGIALWALSHIPANGDKAALVLFGTMAFTALVGMPLIDRKREENQGAAWGPFALTTSAIPFLAAIQGRTKIEWGMIRWRYVALGLAIFVALAFGHEWIFGVSPLPG